MIGRDLPWVESTDRRIPRMTTRQRLLIVLTAATALVSAGAGAAAGDRANTASDHSAGQLAFAAGASVSPVPGFTDPRRFAFAALRLPNGSVIGHASIHNPALGDSQVSLNCFDRQGSQALVGGIVTRSSDPAQVGVSAAFAIQDGPDAISFFLNNGPGGVPPVTCANLLEQTGAPTISALLSDFTPPNAQQWVSLGPVANN